MLRYCSSSSQSAGRFCASTGRPYAAESSIHSPGLNKLVIRRRLSSFLTLSQPASEFDTRGTRRGPPLCDP